MDFTWILAPLLGGAIGYVTNDLAIRMLFRPRRARYLFDKRLPFTPGIIPKEQQNIAKSVGAAISEQLLSGDILREALLSEDMLARVRGAAARYLERAGADERTVWDYAEGSDVLHRAVDGLSDAARREAEARLRDAQTQERLALALHGALQKRVRQSRFSLLAGALDTPASLKALREAVAALLNESAGDIASSLVREGREALLHLKPGALLSGEARREKLCDAAVGLYRDIVESSAQKAVRALDLSAVIERRIAALDMAELETLIMTLARKELRAIVYLGAALGFVMGFVNLLV